MRERGLREFSGRKCRYTQRGMLGTCSAHDNVDEKQCTLGGDTQYDQAPFEYHYYTGVARVTALTGQ